MNSLFSCNSYKELLSKFTGKLLKDKYSVRRAAMCGTAFVIVMSVMVVTMSFIDLTYAVSVQVNGEQCGYVSSNEEVDAAVDKLIDSTVAEGDETHPDVECSYAVVSSSKLISASQLADNIIENDDDRVKAVCVLVNGQPIARADSTKDAQNYLFQLAGNNTFYNQVEVKECVLSKDANRRLVSLDKANDITVDTVIEYEVQNGDTAQSVADKFDISEDSVPSLNGATVSITARLSALALVTYSETYTEEKVSAKQSGYKAGTNVTTTREVYVDGIRCSSFVVGTEFVEKFSDKPVATTLSDAGDYGFCWPVDTGYTQYVSSYWGDGRGHQGYDIAAKKGTPILSVLDGTVVSINSSGSAYGQHFVVDHGNGLKTLYAHCSKLYVSVGDHVERGEVVALIGSTGRSTGTHLHFEVYKNGTKVNPTKYIGLR